MTATTAKLSTGLQTYSVLVNASSTLIVSISMGINAVVLPTSMERLGINSKTIGLVLSMEILASLLMCFFLTPILRSLGMKIGILLTTLIRVPPLFIIGFTDNLWLWAGLIFLHGVGSFTFLIMLQTWVNSIEFERNKGLMVALYSTAISVGLGLGPVVMQFTDILSPVLKYSNIFVAHQQLTDPTFDFLFSDVPLHLAFIMSAILSIASLIPLLFALNLLPKFNFEEGSSKIWPVIMRAKGPMFAVAMAGVSQFSVTSFVVIYGMRNGFELSDATLLLTAFMIGSLVLEVPLTWLSDIFDRRYVIMVNVMLCMVCAVVLPITIYITWQAWTVMFIWGGVIGAVYSIALALIGDRFEGEDLVAANAGYSVMEAVGGAMGVIAIGVLMDAFDVDGLPYTILLACILYFSFALTRYEVK